MRLRPHHVLRRCQCAAALALPSVSITRTAAPALPPAPITRAPRAGDLMKRFRNGAPVFELSLCGHALTADLPATAVHELFVEHKVSAPRFSRHAAALLADPALAVRPLVRARLLCPPRACACCRP